LPRARVTDSTLQVQPNLPSRPQIRIRPYRLSDVELLYAAVDESRDLLAPWLPWCHPGYCITDSRAWVESQLVAFAESTQYAFVIEEAGGLMLGGCGLNHLNKEEGFANLGYWVRRSWLGLGVASEATRQLAAWAFANTPFVRLEILCCVENTASRRTALSAGAIHEGLLRKRIHLHGVHHDAYLHAIVKE